VLNVDKAVIEAAAATLQAGEKTVLLIGGAAMRERGMLAAKRIAQATGATVLATGSNRSERGAGLPVFSRVAYLGEQAVAQMAGTQNLILAGAKSPVTFFAYPGVLSDVAPADCAVSLLADDEQDIEAALEALADHVAAGVTAEVTAPGLPPMPSGPLDPRNMADAIAVTLPENAIVVEEAVTSGAFLGPALAGAPRHDVLPVMGGAIGGGMPTAVGAAVAAPDRPVLSLQADGSAMYTIQSLWTQAREGLDVTTLIFANRKYQILLQEFAGVGAGAPGEKASAMLSIDNPALDFVAMSKGLGVPADRVETCEELIAALGRRLAGQGPSLIEVVL
jgi:acetolactate synthase-1/2/3 large subunit